MYTSILEGVMLLWFALTIPFLIFVILDIRSIPEKPILKLGFVLVTAYAGVIGAFLSFDKWRKVYYRTNYRAH